ncbi:MAG: DUF1211 domain-containing protein [Sphaerospermopsis sp. SIO1G1]|nr:DUF1211 domain-containing protein [Sphaerospermopsis sp. SIO1G1]
MPNEDNTLPRAKPVTDFHGNERIVALSDGVFAIVITLLVLEIKVPEIPHDLVAKELSHAVIELVPKMIAHAISFVVLGIYWISHHNTFMHIKRHDRVLLWLNILFLMCVASMPFPTGLLSEYPNERISVIAYALPLVFAGISMDVMWWYASTHNLLDEGKNDKNFIAFVHRRNLAAPIAYLLAIGTSFLSLTLAKFVFIFVALYYIFPNPLDRKRHQLSRNLDQ